MRLVFAMVIVFILVTLSLWGEKPAMKEIKRSMDYQDVLIANDVFTRNIKDVEYLDGFIYFLDRHFCSVFKVEFKTGKLIKTIFSRGQGPGELMQPVGLKIYKGKIYVLDEGFNGIKVASTDGEFLTEFRLTGIVGDRNLEINNSNEFLIPQMHEKTNTYVDVFSLEGKFKRSIIQVPPDKSLKLNRIHYFIRADSQDNIILLFTVTGELKKYDKNGTLLWETLVENEVLDSFDTGKVYRSSSETINTTRCIFHLNVLPDDSILVGHCGGGCLYDSNGKMNTVLTFTEKTNLNIFEICDSQLVNTLVFGKTINVYDFSAILK